MRIQLALHVEDLEAAISFYGTLFDTKVNKQKPGYANFAIEDPPLKLVLFEAPEASERLSHLGVELDDEKETLAATDRLRRAGLVDVDPQETTCCYAKQEKVWARDPQGIGWEFYRVLEDTNEFGSGCTAEAAGKAERGDPGSAPSDPFAGPRLCC